MPIYEYECEKHGRFELFFNSFSVANTFDSFAPCSNPECSNMLAERVVSLTAMQPDTMWSGIKNAQGYFTSKKQYLNNLRDKNLAPLERGMIEEVSKKGKNRLKETTEKNAIKTERWLAKELASA